VPVIATSWATVASVLLLSAGLIVTAAHNAWQDRRILRLERRVFELEMELHYPEHYKMFRRPVPSAPDGQGEGGPSS